MKKQVRGATALLVGAAVAMSGALSAALPAVARTPDPLDDLPRMSTPDARDFEAAAELLPEGLVEAVERDLGIEAADYLASAEAAVDATVIVDALAEAGVEVAGSEIDGTELTVWVRDDADAAVVESVGATAIVGEQILPDVSDVVFEAADDLYGGAGWAYETSESGKYVTCSLGFSGYDAAGADVMVTAGHCFDSYSSRGDDPLAINWTKPKEYGGSVSLGGDIGLRVSGSSQYGDGYDVGLVKASASGAVARPSVLSWGSDGRSAPLSESPVTMTGATAATVGAPICKSGATSGWTCGEVTHVDQLVMVSDELVNVIISDACMLPGDSGGAAVIGTAAAGINSGSSFPSTAGDDCEYTGESSVFFPMVSAGGYESVEERYGASWTLCTGPVPVVTSEPGGYYAAPDPLAGTLPCVHMGTTPTMVLYLDDAVAPTATTSPASADSAWSFALDDLALGTHDYVVKAIWGTEESVAATGTFSVTDVPSLPDRIAGADRYRTAVGIAQVWDQSFDAELVFIATGENYPDALSAAAAAAHLGAPVLLTPKGSLPDSVRDELIELDPERVIVLGSTASVSSSVYNSLTSLFGADNVSRFGGVDRYDTMRQVVDFAWDDGLGGHDRAVTIVVANGGNFPDALSAGPAVATDGGAVILVDGRKSAIPSETLALIAELDPDQVIVAGDANSVSSAIYSELEGTFGASSVTRVAGVNRYETSWRLVDFFFEGADAAFFATGEKFPDALAGAALAGGLGVPLIVTPKSCVPSDTRDLVLALGADERVLLGSSVTLSSDVASLRTC